MKRWLAACALLWGLAPATTAAYPIDAWDETGIERLLAFDLARAPLLEAGGIVPGGLWSKHEVRLRLQGLDFAQPAPDSRFGGQIRKLLGGDAGDYGIAVLDLSDPARPLYAEHNGGFAQIPGSVGKILVALAWFQALADLFPDDVEARNRLLRETVVSADAFIVDDQHEVPIWRPGDPKVRRRPIELGDRANLWTWLDWMLSASSNAAASELMAHLVLLKHHGRAYDGSPEQAAAFWSRGRGASGLLGHALSRSVQQSGLDPRQLYQGSLFTRSGRARIPTAGSTATPRGLLHYLLKMEQGRLVDPWSSLQIKRLLYLTDVRIRYASQPALDDSAVYFKSGSLYGCRHESGFDCRKYHGNAKNLMNSIAVVESEQDGRSLHYIAVVLSNVLRKDATDMHRDLARQIHHLIETRHGVRPIPMRAPAVTPSPATATVTLPGPAPEVQPLAPSDQ
ncbi:MAG: class A beta-lactamase-related serine hydrolase [Myxococcota bacterium]|nr:class A beta-lactamase-related serine hydrolase [Myxococcota bacterium]